VWLTVISSLPVENKMNTSLFRGLCRILLVGFLSILQIQWAQAAMVSTDQALSAQKVHADREKIQSFVSRADVQKQLQMLGIKADTAKARIAALSDSEVEMVSGKLDSLPAGGNLSHNDLIIVLLIVIIVVLIV